jgi:mycothiol synthase
MDDRRMLLRSPVPADLEAAAGVIAARHHADIGSVAYTIEDLREQWADPDFDLARDARLAVDPASGESVGYAHVDFHGAFVSIPPEHEGIGIGTEILAWVEARERELGRGHHGQPVAATNLRAAAFLRSHGYERRRGYYRMARPLPADDRPQEEWPAGVDLRPLDPDRDAGELHTVDQAAFRSASDYKPEGLDTFRRRHLDRHDLDPGASRAAWRGDRIVGFLLARRWPDALSGFVEVLGVHPEEHGRGIGTALLRSAFETWAAAGVKQAQLGVSSENPRALRLYERIGMTRRFRIDIWQRDATAPATGATSS